MHSGFEEVDHDVEGCAGHDVDEKSEIRGQSRLNRGHSRDSGRECRCTYDVTLSSEWKTRLLRHMAIATALLPNARQYAAMKRRFDCGKNQMESMSRKLVK